MLYSLGLYASFLISLFIQAQLNLRNRGLTTPVLGWMSLERQKKKNTHIIIKLLVWVVIDPDIIFFILFDFNLWWTDILAYCKNVIRFCCTRKRIQLNNTTIFYVHLVMVFKFDSFKFLFYFSFFKMVKNFFFFFICPYHIQCI